MLTVTELANRSGVTPHAVRYYTHMVLLRPEHNPGRPVTDCTLSPDCAALHPGYSKQELLYVEQHQ